MILFCQKFTLMSDKTNNPKRHFSLKIQLIKNLQVSKCATLLSSLRLKALLVLKCNMGMLTNIFYHSSVATWNLIALSWLNPPFCECMDQKTFSVVHQLGDFVFHFLPLSNANKWFFFSNKTNVILTGFFCSFKDSISWEEERNVQVKKRQYFYVFGLLF